jgi:hypothetical protein
MILTTTRFSQLDLNQSVVISSNYLIIVIVISLDKILFAGANLRI